MSEQRIASNGRLQFLSRGEGPPVILLHGMGASFHDWRYLTPALSGAGFRAFAPDLMGHGSSHKPESPEAYNFANLYASLEAWIEELELERPITLVGHSLGGILAIQYARKQPDRVKSIALIDPFFDFDQLSPLMRLANRNSHLAERALRMAPGWLIQALVEFDMGRHDRYEREVRQQIALDYKRASPHIMRFTATIPDLPAESLGKIEIPALVLWGENDLTLDPATFPSLVSAIPGARGIAIPRCGHQPHLSTPELVNRRVLEFLEDSQAPHSRLGSGDGDFSLPESGRYSPKSYTPLPRRSPDYDHPTL
jgi:pimeloyl-ACP methyl ester carboxylesterase